MNKNEGEKMKKITIYYKMKKYGRTYSWKVQTILPENAIILNRAKEGWQE